MALDDKERLVAETSQTLKPGSAARKWTAVCQGIVAVLLLGVGIVPLAIKYDVDYTNNRWSMRYLWIAETLDNAGSGVWSSVIFIITALVGYNSGKSRSMISLYLLMCLFSVFMSMVVLGVTAGSISVTVWVRDGSSWVCADGDNRIIRFCYGYDYGYRYGSYEATPSEIDCGPFYSCMEQVDRVSKLHLPFYALLMVCAVVEFIAAIFGASWTCVGLCGCCPPNGNRGQPRPQQMLNGVITGGQFVSLGNIPRNGGHPQQQMLVPSVQTMAPVVQPAI